MESSRWFILGVNGRIDLGTLHPHNSTQSSAKSQAFPIPSLQSARLITEAYDGIPVVIVIHLIQKELEKTEKKVMFLQHTEFVAGNKEADEVGLRVHPGCKAIIFFPICSSIGQLTS